MGNEMETGTIEGIIGISISQVINGHPTRQDIWEYT